MLSPTTIASSTTMPRISRNANIETTFTLIPKYGINHKAPKYEMPIPAATQNASAGRKKSTNSANTRTKPPKAFRNNKSMRLLRYTERSRHTTSSTPCCKVGIFCSMYALTALEVVITSGLRVLNRLTNTAGLPLNLDTTSCSAKPSLIWAISPRRIWVPSSFLSTTIFSKS